MIDRISSRPTPRTAATPSSAPQASAQQPATQPTTTHRVGDSFAAAPRAAQHWGTQTQSAGAVTGFAAKKAAPLPADLQSKVGTLGYYKARYDDFVQRNPGKTPPDYYLGYGDKYANRFSKETAPKLSKAGQEWLDKTFQALQQKMEDLRKKDPAAFARLELDGEAFKKFAYGTHPDAYLESGLSKLPPKDLAVIAATPDLKDILTLDGVAQTVETGLKLSKEWTKNAVEAGKDWAKDAGNRIKDGWNKLF
jgi:hypothetical protein